MSDITVTAAGTAQTVELHQFSDEDLAGIFNTVKHAVGDVVHIKKRDWEKVAGTYVVTKINRTTYELIPEAGQGMSTPVRFDKSGVFAGPSTETLPVRTEPLGLGVAVSVKGRDGVWIVVKNSPDAKHTLYPLGGASDGRYLRGVPLAMLTVLTEVLWEAGA